MTLAKELNTKGGTNRFKYQSFVDRIKAIQVDVIHQVTSGKAATKTTSTSTDHNQDPHAIHSHFYTSLQEWKELNCTVHFSDFYRDVVPLCQSFAEVVFYKDRIVDALLRHLLVPETLAYEPILSLMSMLANDLRQEIYAYFPQFVQALSNLLCHGQDAHLIECVFHALGFLYKYLWKVLVRDINTTFDLISPLLRERQAYLRMFAGPGFAFLLRKVEHARMQEAVRHLLTSVQRDPVNAFEEYREGLAMLLAETMKGPGRGFHSKIGDVWNACCTVACDQHQDELIQDVLEKSLVLLLVHGNAESAKQILDIIVHQIRSTEGSSETLAPLVRLLKILASARKGNRTSAETRKSIYDTLRSLCEPPVSVLDCQHLPLLQEVYATVAVMTRASADVQDCMCVRQIVDLVLTKIQNPRHALPLLKVLVDAEWPQFTAILFPSVVSFLDRQWNQCPEEMLLFLAYALRKQAFDLSTLSSVVTEDGRIRFPSQSIPKLLLDLVRSSTEVKHISAAVSCLPYVATNQATVVWEELVKLFHTSLENISTSNTLLEIAQGPKANTYGTVGFTVLVLRSLLGLAEKLGQPNLLLALKMDVVDRLLLQHFDDERVVEIVHAYLQAIRTVAADSFSVSAMEQIFHAVKANLQSISAPLRLFTLRILALYDQLEYMFDPSISSKERKRDPSFAPFFQLCLDVEETPDTVTTFREKLLKLRRIEAVAVTHKALPYLYAEVVPRLCCGLLTVNFQPIWEETMRILFAFGGVSFVNPQGKTVTGGAILWDIWWKEVSHFATIQASVDAYARPRLTDDVTQLLSVDEEVPVVENNNITKGKTAGLASDLFADSTLEWINKLAPKTNEFFQNTADNAFVEMMELLCPAELRDPARRFDAWNYYGLLMKAITNHAPKLAESHTEQLVPMFLNFYRSEYENGGLEAETTVENVPRINRQRLVLFLELVSKFRRPLTSIPSTEWRMQLRDIYLHMLTKNDPQLQRLALACLETFKEEVCITYSERLHNLVDDKKFRDELASLNVESENDTIPLQHRFELMRLIIRILFGKVIRKKAGGTTESGSVGSMIARRSAALSFLAGCQQEELQFFVDLVLQPFGEWKSQTATPDAPFVFCSAAEGSAIPHRTQMGYLHLLEDICKQMGAFLAPFLPQLLSVLLHLLHDAQRRLDESNEHTDDFLVKRAREVRSVGLRRLANIFSLKLNNVQNAESMPIVVCPFDFQPYMRTVFDHILAPRIKMFEVENTQSPTALMDLFWCWSASPVYRSFLVEYEPTLLPKVFSCMSAVNVKSTVISRVLDIVENLLNAKTFDGDVDKDAGFALIKPFVTSLLDNLDHLLQHAPSLQLKGAEACLSRDTLTSRQIYILSEVAAFTEKPDQLWRLVDLLLPFLKKSPTQVPENTKANILMLLQKALGSWSDQSGGAEKPLTESHYYTICSHLFSSLSSRPARRALLSVFGEFQQIDVSLQTVFECMQALHAEGGKRLDERDWETVMPAFHKINEELYREFTAIQWLPMLHCLIHFCHDMEEISIRSNAGYGLCRFAERVQSETGNANFENLYALLIHVVLPAIKRSMKSHHENVRSEFVGVLGKIVSLFPEDTHFADMVPLLAKGDVEASFFNNIYHVQIHRRTRALRRLAEFVQKGDMQTGNLTNIFIPLVVHFVFEVDRKTDHQLIQDSMNVLGVMCGKLSWNQYYGTVKGYFRLLAKKPALEKMMVRTILAILEHFHWDLSQVDPEAIKRKLEAQESHVDSDETKEEDAEEEGMEVDEVELDLTLEERIVIILTKRLLPDLYKLLSDHKEGEANLNIRVPIAIAYAKLLKQLPPKILHLELPRLLTTVAQILRSRSQEVRDTTRDTLVKIALILGSKYFLFMIKELSGALHSGYQLHVLGYSVHCLLANVLPTFEIGDIDYCLAPIVEILLNDIFGDVGKEKEVDELAQKMKETKSKRSFEAFELLAKHIRFGMVERILMPVREMMIHMQTTTFTRNTQELLRRLVIGLNQNPEVDRVEFLIFVFQLISREGNLFRIQQAATAATDNYERNFTVQTFERTDSQIAIRNHFTTNEHMFIEFGYRLLVSALKHDRFEHNNPEHVKILDPMLEGIRDGMFSKYSEIVVSALRVLCILTKFKLPSMKKVLPGCFERCCKLISRASSTGSETVQNCFKLITVVLRDCKSVQVKEKQLVALLEMIRPDLEECDHQNTTFSLLKAILARKLVAPEIYDLMDDVSRIMIANQTSQIRELSRHALLQFLLDYPLGARRLEKHMMFLIKNLEYVHESGRESVLEFLNSVTIKFPQETLDQFAEMLFLALVVRVVNEESAKCRDMAIAVVQSLLRRISLDKVDTVMSLTKKWSAENTTTLLNRTYAQMVGMVVDAFAEQPDRHSWLLNRYCDDMKQSLQKLMNRAYLELEEATDDQETEEMEEDENTWKIAYFGLNSYGRLCNAYPGVVSDPHSESMWKLVHKFLPCYHSWVQMAASRLFGTYFAAVDPSTQVFTGTDDKRSHLLSDPEMVAELAQGFLTQLKTRMLNEELGLQLVKNLFFIGRVMHAFGEEQTTVQEAEMEEEDAEEDGEEVESENDANEEETDEATETRAPKSPRRLHWLFRRLSFLARGEQLRPKGTIVQTQVYRWFAAMANFLSKEALEPFLVPILSPMYRTVMEETKTGAAQEELKSLTQEIMGLIETKMGTTAFHEARTQVERHVLDMRAARKKQRRQQAVINPEAHAKRKIAKNLIKRNSRKRKIDEFQRVKLRHGVKKSRRAQVE